jgi:hypothetical protein
VWDIIKVVTFALKLVVLTCVLSQSKGHWLLSNTLTITITLTMTMEAMLLQLFSSFEVFDPFEAKILLLHRNMRLEVIKVIKQLLNFLRFFYAL